MSVYEIATLVASIMAVLFGSAGLAAFYQAKKTADVGEAEVTVKARTAATADWEAVKDYWEEEIAALRAAASAQAEKHNTEIAALRGQIETIQRRHEIEREADRAHIVELENHIWLGRPAPPPARRQPRQTEA